MIKAKREARLKCIQRNTRDNQEEYNKKRKAAAKVCCRKKREALKRRDSCPDLFKKVYIPPLQSQYIFYLLMFVVKNKDFFKMNSDVHSFNTRSHYDLHIPAANLAVFQKGVCYAGINIYNLLPPTLKQLSYDIS
jgi:hypothetical protein